MPARFAAFPRIIRLPPAPIRATLRPDTARMGADGSGVKLVSLCISGALYRHPPGGLVIRITGRVTDAEGATLTTRHQWWGRAPDTSQEPPPWRSPRTSRQSPDNNLKHQPLSRTPG